MSSLLPDESDQPLRDVSMGGPTLVPEQDQTVIRLRAAMGAAAPRNPDKSAEVFQLQTRTGLPNDVIERNLEEIKAEAAKTSFDAEELRAKSPLMARWLASHPDHMAIAKDDLDNLGNIEAFTRALTRGIDLGRKQTFAGRLAHAEMAGKTDPSDSWRLRELEQEIEKEPTGQGFMRQYVYRSAKILGQLYESSSRATTVGLATGAAGAAVGGVASLATGPAAPLTAPVTAASGFVLGATTGTIAGFIEDTYRTEAGLAYLSLRKIKTPDGGNLNPDLQKGAAVFVGLGNAALEYLGARMVAAPFVSSGKMLFADTARAALAKPTTASALMQFGKSWGTAVGGEVATELMQEGVNIFAEEVAKTVTDPRFKTIMRDPAEREAALERLASIAEETFKGMALLGVPGAGLRGAVEYRKAQEAKDREAAWTELGKGVGRSKTFERLPEKVQEAIASMTADGPIEHLYLPTDTFTLYWQGQNIDPRDVARELFGSTQVYDDAVSTGADIQIKTDVYATKIAPTEHNKYFAREVRRAPDEMNAREGDEFLTNVKAEEKARKEKEQAAEEPRRQVASGVAKQLEEAGFEKTAAATMGEQMGAFFSTQAERMGDTDPLALFQRYGLKVQHENQVPQTADQVFNQVRRVATDPKFVKQFGQSVTLDMEGNPQMFYHGSSRDIYEWRPKQAGAIYVTPDVDLAEDFTKYSMDYAQRNGIKDAAPVIYPLYVKAERPFDYDSPEHIVHFSRWAIQQPHFERRVVATEAAKQLKDYFINFDHLLEKLREGSWGAIEHPLTQEYIKANGYDGFYVMEAGVKNLAVFSPDQLFNALTGENLSAEDPNILFQSGTPWYYSELSRKVTALKQGAGSPQQWAGIISNLQGVKEQEIAWSGVIEWLGTQTGRVTKKQITDFLDANGVQVTETLYGDQQKTVMKSDFPPEIELTDLDGMAPQIRDAFRKEFNVPADHTFVMHYNMYTASLVDENFTDEEYAETLGVSVEQLQQAPTVRASGRTPGEAGIALIEALEQTASAAQGAITVPIIAEYERIAQELRSIYDTDETGDGIVESKFNTRYGDSYLKLPGGENYRELLLHLPQGNAAPFFVEQNEQSGEWAVVDRESGQEIASFETEEEAKKRAETEIFEDGVNRGYSHNPRGPGGGFQSSHWDQENIIAHVRFDERVDAEGKKVLFIEEIQSDWAQQGREHGFDDGQEVVGEPEWRFTYQGGTSAPFRNREELLTYLGQSGLHAGTEGMVIEEVRPITPAVSDIPRGPFVENTDAWVGLTMKRMIRWAAENGYDRVAWTTGDQQNKRNNLSRRFSEIRAFLHEPGRYNIAGEVIEGRQLQDTYTAGQLPGVVGQELAEKIINDLGSARSLKDITDDVRAHLRNLHDKWVVKDSEVASRLAAIANNQAYGHRPYWIETEEGGKVGSVYQTGIGHEEVRNIVRTDPVLKRFLREWDNTVSAGIGLAGDPVNARRYTGLDLEVGGEGMREFYDKIVVKVTNDLLKKFGGGKTKPLKVAGAMIMGGPGMEYRARIIPGTGGSGPVRWGIQAIDSGEDASWLGEGREWVSGDDISKILDYDSKNEAETRIRELSDKPVMMDQLGFDITPELRQKALTGLPLFQDKKRGFIRFGEDRKFQIGVLENADLSTFLHESGHFYLEVMKDLVKDLKGRAQQRTSGGHLQMSEHFQDPDFAALIDMVDKADGEFRDYDKLPVRSLRPSEVRAIQGHVNIKEGFRRDEGGIDKRPIVLELADGSLHIFDGHHRFAVAAQQGDKPIEAWILKLEGDFPKKYALTDKQRQILADADTLAKWLGVKSLDDIKVEHHEMFARANEAYLMDNRAPSGALRAAFMRFRAWLVALYRTVNTLGVRLNDDVREVFDRLYATDAEIDAVRHEGELKPIFLTPEQAKMTPEQFEAYRKTVEDASRSAQEQLQQRLMAEYQREKKAWWREARADVYEDVSKEFNNKREYITMAVLRSGELPGGEPLPEGMEAVKLDKAALEEVYGSFAESDVMKRLQRLGIYRDKGGVLPDVAAEAFGFKSGDEMIKALINLKDRKTAINEETDARMLAKYGSMLLDGSLSDKARAAVMNEAQSKVLHAELRALWAQVRAARPVVQQVQADARRARSEGLDVVRTSVAPLDLIRQVAQEQIARTRVRDLTPHKFYVAARRHALRAADEAVKGNYELAASAKQRQLLNLELYREAMNAREEVDETVAYMRGLRSPRVQQRLGKAGAGYLDQIQMFLDRFDFARVTLRESDKRMSLAQWIKNQEDQGFTVDLPENIINEAFRKPWREMTYEEIIGVRDATRHVMHLSKLKTKLLKVQDQRDFDIVKDEIVQSLEKNARHDAKSHKETRLPQEETVRGISGFFASHRKLASLIREMDGFKDGGPLWNYLGRELNKAGTQEASLHAAASKKLKKIFAVYGLKDLVAMYRKQSIPEINDSLSKQAILMVALNWGNEDNRQKLMDGYGWGPTQVQAILQRMDERDWKFVQSIWDFVNEFWPQIESKQKRITGVAPQKVEATPVSTPFGEFEGGYFPLKYDDRQSPRAFGNRVKEVARLTELGGFVRATTRRGHTIERIEGVKQQVRLDFGVILEHTHQVIHDLTHHETLIDANRLVGSRDFSRAVIEYFGDQVYDQMRSALTDIAAGNVPAQGHFEKGMNWMRHGTSIAMMGWNLMTGLMQFFGISQSIVRVGAVNIAKGLGHWLGDAMQMENSVKWVHVKSEFMRARHDTMMREVNEIRNAIRVRGKLAPIEDSYFWLITRMQMMVDIPTWLGAYEKFMAEHGDEAKAVDQADAMVLESQGGGQVKDLARVQRGGPLLKLWTNFYSYFNVTFNLTAESFRKNDLKTLAGNGRMAVDILLLYVFPSVLVTVLKEAIKGDTDDKDKLLEKIVREQISYILGSVLIARELSGAAQGFYGYEGPAGAKLFSEMGKLIKQLEQGDMDAALVKSLNMSAGILFHYPAGQVQKTADGFIALSEGRTNNPLAILFGPKKEAK